MMNNNMKKIIFLFLYLCTTTLLFAKTDSIPTTYLGIRGGANFTQMLSTPSIPQVFLLGTSAGIGLKHVNEKGLGIQVELNYSEAGWEEFLGSEQQYKRKLTYLELPFFTHIALGKKAFKPFLQLGAYMAWRLDEKESIQNIDLTVERSFYYQEDLTVFSYGVGGGLGFSLKTKIGTFQLEGRYLNSLRNNFDVIELGKQLKEDFPSGTLQSFTFALNMQIGGYFSYWITL